MIQPLATRSNFFFFFLIYFQLHINEATCKESQRTQGEQEIWTESAHSIRNETEGMIKIEWKIYDSARSISLEGCR